MRELIVRMTVTDGDAASALRVISHFDALVEHGASTAAIVRAAAALSGSIAGWRDGAGDRTTRMDPAGRTLLEPAPSLEAAWPRVLLDRSGTSSVWLEPTDDDGPLDQLIVERCAQALRAKMPRGGRAASPHELARIACEPEVTDRERADALLSLGLTGRILVAVTSASVVPVPPARCLLDDQWIVLAHSDTGSRSRPGASSSSDSGSSSGSSSGRLTAAASAVSVAPANARVGLCVVDDGDVPGGIRRARRALDLAVAPACGGPTHVTFEALGALATFAEAVDSQAARTAPEIVLLEALRARRPWVPATLRAVTIEASLRQAAARLHLHHSSLSARLEWLASELGYAVTSPAGRERAAAAWALWRISGLLHEDAPH